MSGAVARDLQVAFLSWAAGGCIQEGTALLWWLRSPWVVEHRNAAAADGKARGERVQLDTDRERWGGTGWGGRGGMDGHTASKGEGEIP